MLYVQKPSSGKGSTSSLMSAKGSSTRVTKQEFDDFCEGEEDPMLRFLADELRELQVNASISQTMLSSKQDVRYQNTYRTEPTYKFFPDQVAGIIQKALVEKLEGLNYEPKKCSQLACELSGIIKEAVKTKMSFPRHKMVSFVTIGERSDQGAMVGSRCVWNAKFDGFASSSFKNDSLFAVGVLYAVYME